MGGTSEKTKKRHFPHVKTWQLFAMLIPLLFAEATFMRLDHIKMVELRDAVMAADEENNDEKITQTLNELKEFTFSHIVINITEKNGNNVINFGTGTFYLENQYLRHASAALEKAEQEAPSDSNQYGNIFALAAEVCKPQAIANGWRWNSAGYINCMTGELAKYPASSDLEDTIRAVLPSTELYRHEYVSPLWAFSLSGVCTILCLLIIVVIIIRIFIWIILRVSLFILNRI